jgi:hypothetical protein
VFGSVRSLLSLDVVHRPSFVGHRSSFDKNFLILQTKGQRSTLTRSSPCVDVFLICLSIVFLAALYPCSCVARRSSISRLCVASSDDANPVSFEANVLRLARRTNASMLTRRHINNKQTSRFPSVIIDRSRASHRHGSSRKLTLVRARTEDYRSTTISVGRRRRHEEQLVRVRLTGERNKRGWPSVDILCSCLVRPTVD